MAQKQQQQKRREVMQEEDGAKKWRKYLQTLEYDIRSPPKRHSYDFKNLSFQAMHEKVDGSIVQQRAEAHRLYNKLFEDVFGEDLDDHIDFTRFFERFGNMSVRTLIYLHPLQFWLRFAHPYIHALVADEEKYKLILEHKYIRMKDPVNAQIVTKLRFLVPSDLRLFGALVYIVVHTRDQRLHELGMERLRLIHHGCRDGTFLLRLQKKIQSALKNRLRLPPTNEFAHFVVIYLPHLVTAAIFAIILMSAYFLLTSGTVEIKSVIPANTTKTDATRSVPK